MFAHANSVHAQVRTQLKDGIDRQLTRELDAGVERMRVGWQARGAVEDAREPDLL